MFSLEGFFLKVNKCPLKRVQSIKEKELPTVVLLRNITKRVVSSHMRHKALGYFSDMKLARN